MIKKNLSNVAILAGGLGTRLKTLSTTLPKPMYKIGNKPILENIIDVCRNNGFNNITLLVSFNHKLISDYFEDGKKWGVNITYSIENEPMGTTAAIYQALDLLDERFFILYGDTFLNISLRKILQQHDLVRADATLLLHPNDHPYDSDLVEINFDNFINKIHGYPHQSEYHRNLVNAGLYFVNKNIFKKNLFLQDKKDLAKHFFPNLLSLNYKLYGFISTEYIKDMGTPSRLQDVIDDFNNGKHLSLSQSKLQKAIFLDRDGTINRENGYINCVEKIDVDVNVSRAIKNINKNSYLCVCITNQPVIARGELSFQDLNKIHGKIDYLLGQSGAYIDRYYVCPHHPDKGYEGEVSSLKINCNCRKPNTGLIDIAIDDMNISKKDSWFIGDSTGDILAGNRAGLKTILLRTGNAGFDNKYNIEPDYVMENLEQAVNWILYEQSRITPLILKILPEILNKKIILIGGLARSGKSTFSKTLSHVLNDKNISNFVISLDGWLVNTQLRDENTELLKRYNISTLIEQLNLIIEKPSLIDIPVYCRKQKKIKYSYKKYINEKEILIIEGVPALCMNELLEFDCFKIFLKIDEETRHKRFIEDYKSRGLSEEQINKLYNMREVSEKIVISKSLEKANTLINL